MSEQLMLSSFSTKTISMDESSKGFRPWNNNVFDWEVGYQGYYREEGKHEGYVDFHVLAEIREALVKVRKDNKTYRKIEVPGYKLIITQKMALTGREWESYVVFEEAFPKEQFRKAFDVFRREVLNIQGWIKIAESRARLMPDKGEVFECVFCGWVTDTWTDDILCEGCGKRYWSDKLWAGLGDTKAQHMRNQMNNQR